ncbi:MAG: hypothetical protein LUC91_04790 [Prevotella sp.]|nr:hypothetical protein [Prevotella sp.]
MKNKVIIALCGAANRGKTITLLKLIDLLKGNQTSEKRGDRREVCEYKGKRIVVTTPGDSGDVMSDNIQFMRENAWDLAVTATRTRGATQDLLIEYAKQVDAEIRWIYKPWVAQENEEEENSQCAAKLLQEIDGIIDEQ